MGDKKDLSLYVTAQDYAAWAGPDWPSYPDYLNGAQPSSADVRSEIDRFTNSKIQEGVRFPIRVEPACQSKWTWSTLWLNEQASSSCHRAGKNFFSLDDFDNFHNLPKKIQDRELMLQGQWPQTGGCSYCQEIEQAGGWSDRLHNNEIRGLTPPELETDATAVRVSPRLVEIFADNTCNMSCLYCNDNLSSRIQVENAKFGSFSKDGVIIPVSQVSTTKSEFLNRFLAWLTKNSHGLKRLHLLGGETFLQHNLMEPVLEVLDQQCNPNLELCVFSNLMVPDRYWDRYISQIRRLQEKGSIKIFDLTASIDCWGPEAEFVRWGLDLDRFEKRLTWAAQQSEQWLRLTINQTICSLTMRTMPALIHKITELRQHRSVGHYFEFVNWDGVPNGLGHWLHPKWFGWDFWQEDVARILDAMPRRNANEQESLQRLDGIFSLLRDCQQPDPEMIRRLHVYLDEMDRRRGTHWRDVFPYLDLHV